MGANLSRDTCGVWAGAGRAALPFRKTCLDRRRGPADVQVAFVEAAGEVFASVVLPGMRGGRLLAR
jgi:hypothetical protein